jgi:alkaline phosphatase D
MFSPLNRTTVVGDPPTYDTIDSWEAYVAERQQIRDWLVEHGTENPVVLTGDTHQNWVRNIPRDYRDLGSPPVATELMVTSVSTGGNPNPLSTRWGDDPNNPHVLFRNNNRGYVRCTVTPDSWTSDYRKVDTVEQPTGTTTPLATAVIENGVRGAQMIRA